MLNVSVWGIPVAKYLLAISLSKLEASRIISCNFMGPGQCYFLAKSFSRANKRSSRHPCRWIFFLWVLFLFGFWWVGLGVFEGGVVWGGFGGVFFCLFIGVCWLLGS